MNITPNMRSVIDLIRAQCVGAAGKVTRRWSYSYSAVADNAYLDGTINAMIFAPHGGSALDSRRTARSYVAA